MTERRLAALMAETAEEVPAPALARTAWDRARQVRRRRRVVTTGLAAAVTAVVVGVTATLTTGGGAPVARPSPSPTVSNPKPAGSNVQRVPDALPVGVTGRVAAEVPDFATATIPGLSRRTGHAAAALYEPNSAETAEQPADVYAWLDDGTWARIDGVRLEFARDEGGNQQNPLDSTSLSRDGRFAAFAQQDEVVVVTVATAAVQRFAVPGFNEHVIWRGEDLLVGQDQAAYLLEPGTGRRTQLTVSGWDLIAGGDPAAALLDLPPAGTAGRVLREWSADGAALRRTTPVDGGGVAPAGVEDWYGRGWRTGDFVVRSGFGHADRESGIEVVAVLDVRSGAVVRLLTLAMDRWKGCCEPLGWLDADTVLLRLDPDGIVAWNVWSGSFARVAGPFNGTIAVA